MNSIKDMNSVIKYQMFKMFLLFGVNICKLPYEVIPQTTRFFRNKPLLYTLFELLKNLKEEEIKCFFHAASSGEEAYSFLMFNQENYRFNMIANAGEYERSALTKIIAATYSANVIESINKDYIEEEYLKYFEHYNEEYIIKNDIKKQIHDIIECDYTKMKLDFLSKYQSDVVFCNNTLLYHEHKIQEKVLTNLCQQATKILVITGAENSILEEVLPQYSFYPYHKNWEEIYDGWKLRRCVREPIYPTPTTPYLTDANKFKEHFFKYSIFVKSEIIC